MKRVALTTWGWLALCALVLLLPTVVTGQYVLRVLGIAALNGALAVSFAVIVRSGYVSMAHTAFAAMGAYLSAALIVHAHWNFWLALPIALLVIIATAFGIGWLTLRLKGAYFFLISFCFLEATVLFFGNVAQPIFGGPNGIVPVPRPSPILLGFATLSFNSMRSFYYCGVAVMLLCAWVIWRIMSTRYGRILLAAQQSDTLAATVGVNIFAHKLMAFVLCSTMAGLAGAVLGNFNGIVQIDDYAVSRMVMVVTFAVVGGTDMVWGPAFGAVLLILAGERLRSLHDVQLLGYGLLLILVMVIWPSGLAGMLQHLYRKLTGQAREPARAVSAGH